MMMRHLKTMLPACVALAGALGFGALAWAAPNAQEILAASDAVRNPNYPFGLTTTLVEYRNGKQTSGSTLAIYSKEQANGGQRQNHSQENFYQKNQYTVRKDAFQPD